MATVVGLFSTPEQAQDAVARLRSINIPDSEISIATQSPEGAVTQTDSKGTVTGTAIGAAAGGVLGGIAGLFVGIGAITIPGVGPLAVGGPLAATLLGAGVGAATGGLVGALVDVGVPEQEAIAYEEGVKQGGVLVTARVPDGMETAAQVQMNQANARDPHASINSTREDNTMHTNDVPDTQPDGTTLTDDINPISGITLPTALDEDVPVGADIAAMSGPGIMGGDALGGPVGLTARAAVVGAAQDTIDESEGKPEA